MEDHDEEVPPQDEAGQAPQAQEEQAQPAAAAPPPEAANGGPGEDEEEDLPPQEEEANGGDPQGPSAPAAAAAEVPMDRTTMEGLLRTICQCWSVPQDGLASERQATLYPGSIRGVEPLDYHTKADMQLFRQGSAALPDVFTGSSSQLHPFLNQLRDRGVMCGWIDPSNPGNSIFMFQDDAGGWIDILREYGKLPMSAVRNEAQRWVGEGDLALQRKPQNNIMAVTCIRASLSRGVRDRLRPHKSLFTIEDTEIAPLMIQALVDMTTSSSRATNQALRDMMRDSQNIMIRSKQNISNVNVVFTDLIDQMHARDLPVDDAIDNVAACYLTCKDASFVEYISHKYEAYCDKTLDCTVYTFMEFAEAFYNTRITKGKWLNKITDKAKIVALSSQVSDLNSKFQQAMAAQRSIQAKRAEVMGGLQLAESTKKPFVRRLKNKKSKSSASLRAGQKADELWKKVPPGEGEPETKRVNGKVFNWCIHHMCWTVHRPSDCRLGHQQQSLRSNRGYPMANNATFRSTRQQAATSSTNTREMNYLARVAEVSRDL